MLAGSDAVVPEDLQEISRKGSREIREVRSESEFVEEARRARAVRIPSSPDACAVGLSCWLQGGDNLWRERELVI